MIPGSITIVALLAACGAVGAIPAAAPVARASNFSFVDWVDQIIANPDGDHLTPEQAVAAFYAGQDTAGASDQSKRDFLGKRWATCDEAPGTHVSVPDAVACINFLASLGSAPCRAQGYSRFCTMGTAIIDGNSRNAAPTSSTCNDVARGAGAIMDQCTRPDGTVQGFEYAYGNGNLLVRIHRVGT